MSEKKRKQKKKHKFSPLRVIIGLIVGLFLLAGLLYADDRLANMPYYEDILPQWSNDGKYIIYVRWLPIKNGVQNPFQLWRINPDGSSPVRIYESHGGYTTFGIRRMKFSSDGKFIEMRLNRKDYISGDIKDMLVRVPINGSEPAEEWELEKKYPYDVFLAFHNDRVIIRRMSNSGKASPNNLYEASFSDRKILRKIPLPAGSQMCCWAEYFGPQNRLFGLLRQNGKRKENIVYDFDKKRRIRFSCPVSSFEYLPFRNRFVGFDVRFPSKFMVLSEKGKLLKRFEGLSGDSGGGAPSLAHNGRKIAVCRNHNLEIYDLESFQDSYVPVKVKIRHIGFGPHAERIAFSDGSSIYTVNVDGGEMRHLTMPSKKSVYLDNKYYRKYLEYRNLIIYGKKEI